MSIFGKSKTGDISPETIREPYLKTIDHSGALIREMDEDNTERFRRPERVIIKTKGELENGDKSD